MLNDVFYWVLPLKWLGLLPVGRRIKFNWISSGNHCELTSFCLTCCTHLLTLQGIGFWPKTIKFFFDRTRNDSTLIHRLCLMHVVRGPVCLRWSVGGRIGMSQAPKFHRACFLGERNAVDVWIWMLVFKVRLCPSPSACNRCTC